MKTLGKQPPGAEFKRWSEKGARHGRGAANHPEAKRVLTSKGIQIVDPSIYYTLDEARAIIAEESKFVVRRFTPPLSSRRVVSVRSSPILCASGLMLRSWI